MWFWVQAVLAVTISVVMVGLYWRFLADLVRFLVDHIGQAVILVLVFLTVYAQVGTSLGIPYLFWNEEPLTRFVAAVGCTLVLALLGINAYYLIPEQREVEVMGRIKDFLDRRMILKLSFGRWLEPSKGNTVELSQFLRATRFPFLLLLLLPALLPLVFPNVPRYAPVYSNDLMTEFSFASEICVAAGRVVGPPRRALNRLTLRRSGGKTIAASRLTGGLSQDVALMASFTRITPVKSPADQTASPIRYAGQWADTSGWRFNST